MNFQKIITLIISLCLCLSIFSQTAKDYQNKIDSLESLKITLVKQLDLVDNEILRFKQKKSEVWADELTGSKLVFTASGGALYNLENHNKLEQKVGKGTIVIVSKLLPDNNYEVLYDGSLYFLRKAKTIIPIDEYIFRQENIIISTKSVAKVKERPSPVSKIIAEIPKEQEVIVLGYEGGYFELKYQNIQGFASDMYFNTSPETRKLISENKKKRIIEKYGETIANKIFNHSIWLGMTSSMLRDSWGNPGDINRTVTEGNVSEQWIYNKRYVYLDNGVVTAWQD